VSPAEPPETPASMNTGPVRSSQTFDVPLPPRLRPLLTASQQVDPRKLSRYVPPDDPGLRQSAVLILLADDGGPQGPDVLLTERAWTLRSHAGQMSFPGGRLDEADGHGLDGVVSAALREAEEETGLDPEGVDVFAVWPALWVPVSNYAVSPVLAWWREPSPVAVVDPAEVASVHRVHVHALVDPANRVMCRHPSGYVGPAFVIHGLFVWGFTAGLLDRMLMLAGWAKDWDTSQVVPLPDRLVEASWRDHAERTAVQRRLTAIEHDLGAAGGEAPARRRALRRPAQNTGLGEGAE
jgi:8-oxo-dGTP pyrophosphatase MutT (NUDIX family)